MSLYSQGHASAVGKLSLRHRCLVLGVVLGDDNRWLPRLSSVQGEICVAPSSRRGVLPKTQSGRDLHVRMLVGSRCSWRSRVGKCERHWRRREGNDEREQQGIRVCPPARVLKGHCEFGGVGTREEVDGEEGQSFSPPCKRKCWTTGMRVLGLFSFKSEGLRGFSGGGRLRVTEWWGAQACRCLALVGWLNGRVAIESAPRTALHSVSASRAGE
ncbi:hypothetical protein VTI74DRAFT_1044 [Chaetomium olivicolor]